MNMTERIWAWPWEVNPNMGQWETERSIAGDGEPYVPEAALTAAQAEIARLTAERDAAMAGRVKVKPLVWERNWGGCCTVKSKKASDNGCDVVFYSEKSNIGGYVVSTITKPGYFRCWSDSLNGDFDTIESAQSAAQADYEARIRAAIQLDTERAEPVACPAGWFGFDISTGEYTAEWCSVKPSNATGFVPLYATPQAREITVQEAAGALLDKDGRADAKLVDIADEIYAAGGSMSRAIGVALRAIAAMQKGG